MDDLTHETRHPIYHRYFLHHRILEEDTEHAGAWRCSFCQCPHIKMPDVSGVLAHHVAVESRPCLYTFENPCVGCGKLHQCAPDCTFISTILDLLREQGYELLD